MSDSEKSALRTGGQAGEESPPASSSDTPEVAAQPQAEFREGGYGWVVVIATALLNGHTWGLNSSFAVFLAYYLRTNSIKGATTLGFAFVGGMSISIALVVSPLATVLCGMKSFGTKKVLLLGTVFETIAFIGASFTSELWHLLLTQGICFGVGMGLIFVASVPVPSQWFTKKRSLANACAASGSGFGGLTYSLATNAMISSIGLAWTFRVLAIVCFVVNTTCSLLIRDRNNALGSVHSPFNWRLFTRPTYLLYQGWMAFSMLPYCALLFSIVDYAQSVGLTASQASLVGALLNMAQGLGRPLIGLSSDRFGRLNVASFSTLLCSVLCLTLWLFSKTLATCIVFAILVGPACGVMWATAAPVLAEVVGVPLLPSALSMTWIVLVLPSTFSEVIALELRSRSYRDAQLFIGFLYFGAFAFLWILRAWKVDEMARAHLSGAQKSAAVRDDAAVAAVASQSSAGSAAEQSAESATNGGSRSLGMLRGLWALEVV
ncbi:major facilitator superfamily domain-containing protein [Xylariales sp. PMI_506]|nr:major facilitator superfamily domain-containing protein [Xylariales sp. PMI_506]